MGGGKELESSWPQPKVGPGSQHQPLAPALGFPSPLAFPHRLGATSSFPLARGLPYLCRTGRLHTTFLCCERIATPHGITASAWAGTVDENRNRLSTLPTRQGWLGSPTLPGGRARPWLHPGGRQEVGQLAWLGPGRPLSHQTPPSPPGWDRALAEAKAGEGLSR